MKWSVTRIIPKHELHGDSRIQDNVALLQHLSVACSEMMRAENAILGSRSALRIRVIVETEPEEPEKVL